jgi:hypothetical protein
MTRKAALTALIGLFIFIIVTSNAYAGFSKPDWAEGQNWSYAQWTNWNWSYDDVNTRWDCSYDDYQDTISSPAETSAVIWSELPATWRPEAVDHWQQEDTDGNLHNYFMKDFDKIPHFGKLKIHIDNSDQPNPEKRIRVQIVSNKRYPDWGEIKILDETLTEITGIQTDWEESFMYTGASDRENYYNLIFDFTLPFNPALENIDITLPLLGMKLDEIRIDTQCVPIPGAIWLVGSGILAVLGSRKRFKKN